MVGVRWVYRPFSDIFFLWKQIRVGHYSYKSFAILIIVYYNKKAGFHYRGITINEDDDNA